MRLRYVLSVALALWGRPGDSFAAEIVRQDAGSRCELKLSGPIQAGDAARFEEAMRLVADRDVVNLCLSSPGGVVGEAVAIIGRIRAFKGVVRTIVDEGGACYSACAMIFMSGGSGAGEARKPERRLHVRAALGFHAPSIRSGTGEYDAAVMRQAHLQALRSLGQLLKATDEPSIPMDLLARLLLARPTEFLMVETVEQAGRWNIDLLGEAVPAPSRRSLDQGCASEMTWRQDFPSEPARQTTTPIGLAPGARFRATFPDYGDEASFTCVSDLFRTKDGVLYLKVDFPGDAAELKALSPLRLEREVRANADPLRRIGTPLWYGRAPGVTLKSLAPR